MEHTFAFICGLIYNGLCRNNFAVPEKRKKKIFKSKKTRTCLAKRYANKILMWQHVADGKVSKNSVWPLLGENYSLL